MFFALDIIVYAIPNLHTTVEKESVGNWMNKRTNNVVEAREDTVEESTGS